MGGRAGELAWDAKQLRRVAVEPSSLHGRLVGEGPETAGGDRGAAPCRVDWKGGKGVDAPWAKALGV